MDIENLRDKILKLGVDEVSILLEEREKRQVRFSNNSIDISKVWLDSTLNVFLSQGKKVFSTAIKDLEKAEELIEKYVKILRTLPENKDFYGINPESQSYEKSKIDRSLLELDLEKIAGEVIEGAIEKGAARAAGVIYRDHVKRKIATNYNYGEEEVASVDVVVRAFNEYRNAGQEAITTATAAELKDPREIGQRAGTFATMGAQPKDGKEGRFTVLFHPLGFGSLVSYSLHLASAFMIDSGMSFFAGKLGEKLFSDKFTLYDDPLFFGSGHRTFDEEATATGKTVLVDRGVIKNYLHSYSTAKKFNTRTTGNAGILRPTPWQAVMENGDKGYEELLSQIDKGLFIVNLWYTRFQDYRNGDFSTIPRDGIFYVEDGEIRESWKGIRVSENMVHLFSNILDVSRERMWVKWWDEVIPSYLPYVLVEDVNITRSTL